LPYGQDLLARQFQDVHPEFAWQRPLLRDIKGNHWQISRVGTVAFFTIYKELAQKGHLRASAPVDNLLNKNYELLGGVNFDDYMASVYQLFTDKILLNLA
jgi:hypothetical protein